MIGLMNIMRWIKNFLERFLCLCSKNLDLNFKNRTIHPARPSVEEPLVLESKALSSQF